MPLPDYTFASISAGLTHAFDFTFYSNNGQIANRIRAQMEAEMPSFLKDIRIDSDSDINVKTPAGTFYVTPSGISTTGWLVLLNQLKDFSSPDVKVFSRAVDILAIASGSMAVDRYSMRILFRFTPEDALGLLGPRAVQPSLQMMLGSKSLQVSSFKNCLRYSKGQFSDNLEVEASAEETEVRCQRGSAGAFDSYQAFLQAASMSELIADVTPFLELLSANEKSILGGPRKSAKS